MGIQVTIETLLQKVDLDSMKMTNQVILGLPNGEKVTLAISDEDMSKIISSRVEGQAVAAEPTPAEPAPKTELEFQTDDNGEPQATFGGGGTQPEPRTETAPAPRRRPQVSRDAMGYPVVSGMEGKDPGEVVASGPGADEDGVASV